MTGARQLNALTSLRFIAAAMIVMTHLRGLFGVSQRMGDPFLFNQGVGFFFILSGFVLTYVYPSLEGIGVRRFLRARVARIWPAHMAALALLLFLIPANARTVEGSFLARLGAQVAMVQSWIPEEGYFFSFNSVAWSISTEFGLYLCFPLLIHNWRRTWAAKLLVVLLVAAGMVWLGNARPKLAVGLIYVNPLSRLFEFTLGMTAALWWPGIDTRLSRRRLPATLVEVIAIGFVVACMYVSLPWALATIPWIGNAGSAWLMNGAIPSLAFALLIVVMASERGLVSRALCSSVPVLLGEISYSVYLLHQILARYCSLHVQALSRVPGWLAFIVFWVVLLLTAYLTYVLIERPIRAWLVRRAPSFGGTRDGGQAPGLIQRTRRLVHPNVHS